MFGALNRFISVLDAAPEPEPSKPAAYGFQVLRNQNTELAVEPWFDFVVAVNGRGIDNPDPSLFATELKNSAGTNVELSIYSAKGSRSRSLWVTIPEGQLGLAIQWAPLSAGDDVWHVLDVAPDSPADEAGLLPYGDYIIGSPEGVINGKTGLSEIVEHYNAHSLRLYVYNHEYNVTRLVTITPSKSWGGEGALGCTTAYGALHRIPASLEEPPQAPGETLFETARLSSDVPRSSTATPQFLVPAEVESRPKPKKQAKKAVNMDEYFQEGEEKSRAQDFAPTSTPTAPPPKKG